MSELRELYQQVILDHNKSPRNFREIEDPSTASEGFNPLCGDSVKVFIEFEGDVVKDISFQGSGCAISKASASIMTSELKGKSRAEVKEMFDKFHRLVTENAEDTVDFDHFGKLAVFAGIREFPSRVKCASLAWHTMKAALNNENEPVTTE